MAEVAVGWHDVAARDEAVLGLPREPGTVAVLAAAARACPRPWDAPLCAVLGWLAYQGGDGAVALVAVERALDSDPRYSLAHLLDGALERQVPPSVLEAVVGEVAALGQAPRPAAVRRSGGVRRSRRRRAGRPRC